MDRNTSTPAPNHPPASDKTTASAAGTREGVWGTADTSPCLSFSRGG